MKLIQHGPGDVKSLADSIDKEEGGGESDDSENCDDSQIIEVEDIASQSSQASSQMEEFEAETAETFLPQEFGLIEDPGVIRIDNVDYGDGFVTDYHCDGIISFKQSRSFIDDLFDIHTKPRYGLLRFSKSLNDVRQEDYDDCFDCLKSFRCQTSLCRW